MSVGLSYKQNKKKEQSEGATTLTRLVFNTQTNYPQLREKREEPGVSFINVAADVWFFGMRVLTVLLQCHLVNI